MLLIVGRSDLAQRARTRARTRGCARERAGKVSRISIGSCSCHTSRMSS
eukprot:TRINITY_DN1491_c0_g1_i1.p2 TRINITY_DN1491_c0_g1~~TRINITY_DN1491_c0_g1_i1.p2  ORF type:complete len:58 (+),score=10.30 TRINITY_DN1491_c0_g1_i1:29-175(+)